VAAFEGWRTCLRTNLRTTLITLAIVLVYAGFMFATNTRLALLDDESIIIAVAAHPVIPTIHLFLTGGSQHEHPPFSDILLHGWMQVTHYSFFALRVFANLFYIGSIVTISAAAAKLAGSRAYWITLLLGFTWPFGLQYGRITGWYCVSMFLLSCMTLAYLSVLEDRSRWPWVGLGFSGTLLVWSNYFGVALLALLCVDLLLFHRKLARRRVGIMSMVCVFVVTTCLPLVKPAMSVVQGGLDPGSAVPDQANALATFGYPVYSIFGSVAVAPWYWPLSIPVLIGSVLLLYSVWFSAGRRWIAYFAFAILLLALSHHLTIKRVVFLFPWFFLGIGLAAASETSKYPKLAASASVLLIVCGLLGISSGRHYATTNLYEPWEEVAHFVSRDAQHGATLISENPPFFLYLNYQLGLETEMQAAESADLGEEFYREHGYSIVEPAGMLAKAQSLHGKVVMIKGPGSFEDVEAMEALDTTVSARCRKLGEFRAAPDPAIWLKRRFTKDVQLLAYRTDVIWYDCAK
jgi:Dolichyl-phosphate-mannose-protein mannosyltransferase